MDAEDYALHQLGEAARDFALKWKPRPKITGPYARALRNLSDVARQYAVKSDEAWASEVVALKARLKAAGLLREDEE